MATIYARADGVLHTVRGDRSTSTVERPSSADAPLTLDLDEETNTELAEALYFRSDEFRLQPNALTPGAPQLLRNSVPVTIAPPTRAFTDRKALPTILTKLAADSAITAAEQRVVNRVVLRVLRDALRD